MARSQQKLDGRMLPIAGQIATLINPAHPGYFALNGIRG
jgi:hypothetical protein